MQTTRRSIPEAARILGYSVGHLRRLAREGKIRKPDRLHPTGRGSYTQEYLERLLAGEAQELSPLPRSQAHAHHAE
jgi:hypothetical protein